MRRGHHLLDGDVHVLTRSGDVPEQEGEERGHGAVEAGLVLGLKAAVLQRLAVGGPADAHDPARGVGDDLSTFVVTVRPGLAEGGDGGHHEPGILALEGGVIEPQGREVAGGKRLHHDVGAAGQLLEDVGAPRLFQVQRDAALVQVRQQEEQALLRVGLAPGEGRHAPAAFTAGGLDLDDVRPEVAQELGAEGTRNSLAHVQDSEIVERRWDHRSGHASCGDRATARGIRPVDRPGAPCR